MTIKHFTSKDYLKPLKAKLSSICSEGERSVLNILHISEGNGATYKGIPTANAKLENSEIVFGRHHSSVMYTGPGILVSC